MSDDTARLQGPEQSPAATMEEYLAELALESEEIRKTPCSACGQHSDAHLYGCCPYTHAPAREANK